MRTQVLLMLLLFEDTGIMPETIMSQGGAIRRPPRSVCASVTDMSGGEPRVEGVRVYEGGGGGT